MHRQKNNPSTVTKKPRASASGGIVATAISVAVVMTAAATAGTNEGAEEEPDAAMIASAVTATDAIRVTAAIKGRGSFPSRRKACAFRSLRQRRQCTSW